MGFFGKLLSGITNGIGSIFGSGIQAATDVSINNKQMEHDKNMAQMNFDLSEQSANNAYDRQLDMWNKNNSYNSASSQVSRLKDAGLNPALAYGSGAGASTPATSGSAPQGSGSFGHSSQLKQLNVGNALDNAMRLAQIKETNARTSNIAQDTENKEVQKDLTWAEVQNLYQDYQFKTLSYKYQESLFDINRTLKSIQAESAQTDLNQKKATNPLLLDKLREDLEILGINKTMKATDLDYQKAQIVADLVSKYAGATGDVLELLTTFLPTKLLSKMGQMFIPKSKANVPRTIK